MPKLIFLILVFLFVRIGFSQTNTSFDPVNVDFNDIGNFSFNRNIDLENDTINWDSLNICIHPKKVNYFEQINELNSKFQKTKIEFFKESISIDSVSSLFTNSLLNIIIPYWYGTDWKFGGKIDTPQNGAITCAYFTAITLNHMGVIINRNRFASQLPVNMVYSIALDDTVHVFKDSRSKDVIKFIKENFDEGLYLAGLFNHIGYLLYRNNEVFFIHANYFEPSKVIIEKASDSEAFKMGKDYYITSLSANYTFLKRWLNGIRIFVVKKMKY